MRRRVGRPGLVGTMARTAVIAGTATAVTRGVSGAMSGPSKQQQAAAQQQASAQQTAELQAQADELARYQAEEAAEAQQAAIDAAVAQALAAQPAAPVAAAPVAAAPAAPEAAAAPPVDTMAQLQKLGELRAAGVLTEEEFAAQKAKVLGG